MNSSVDKSVARRYDNIAESYARYLADDPYALKLTKTFTDRVGKGKVLDAGCGSGLTTALLSSQGIQPIGLDISKRMIAIAKREYSRGKFCVGDLRKIPFSSESFQGVFCFQVFQHMPPNEQYVVLDEFYRVLSSGGLLMFNTKNVFHPRNFLGSLIAKIEHKDFEFGEVEIGGKTGSYRYFSKENDIVRKTMDAGFDVEEVNAHPLSNWIQVWARKD